MVDAVQLDEVETALQVAQHIVTRGLPDPDQKIALDDMLRWGGVALPRTMTLAEHNRYAIWEMRFVAALKVALMEATGGRELCPNYDRTYSLGQVGETIPRAGQRFFRRVKNALLHFNKVTRLVDHNGLSAEEHQEANDSMAQVGLAGTMVQQARKIHEATVQGQTLTPTPPPPTGHTTTVDP